MSPRESHGRDVHPFVVQASDAAVLRRRLAELPALVARDGLAPTAARLASELSPQPARAALVAADPDALTAHVQTALAFVDSGQGERLRDRRGVFVNLRPASERGRLALLFPGDGSPYLGMMSGLRSRFATLRAWLRRADEVAVAQGRLPLTEVIYPRDLTQEKVRRRAEHRLRRLEHSSTAVLAFNHGLFVVLGELGLRPDALIGHSLGDWSALGAGGVTKVEHFLEHVDRALLLPGHVTRPNARMGLVMASRADVEQVLAAQGGDVYVAMDNGPRRIVIAGGKRAMRAAMETFAARGVVVHRLPYVRAAHTPLCEAVRQPLLQAFERWSAQLPTAEIWSCAAATTYPSDLPAIRRMAVDNIVGCVEFSATVQAAWEAGIRVFVECGARGQLTDCVSAILGPRDALTIALDTPARDDLTELCTGLCALAAEGVPLQLAAWFDGLEQPAPEPRNAAAAVAYLADSSAAFRRHHEAVTATLRAGTAFTTDWMRTQQAALTAHFTAGRGREAAAETARAGPFLGTVTRTAEGLVANVELDVARQPWLRDHSFGWFLEPFPEAASPLPVAPMTVSIEILAEAAALLSDGQPLRLIRDVVVRRTVQARNPRTLEARARRQADGAVATALVEPETGDKLAEAVCEFGRRPAAPAPDAFEPADGAPAEISAATLYAERLMFHGPCYQVLHDLGVLGSDGIVGELRTRPAEELFGAPPASPLLTDPALFDAVGQLFGYWAFARYDENRVVFPTHVGRIELYGDPPPPGTVFRTTCRATSQTIKRLTGDLELSRDGVVFARLHGWRFWRFNWPTSLLTFSRFPARLCPTTPLVETFTGLADVPWAATFTQRRPVELLEFLVPAVLCRSELSRYDSLAGDQRRQQQFYFGRLTAKDALRRWAEDRHGLRLAPTQIDLPPVDGPPTPRFDGWTPPGELHVSLTHVVGFAAAVVDEQPIGIDAEALAPRDEAFCKVAFTAEERAMLGSDARLLTAGWCAKEAAAKASGQGLTDPRRYHLSDVSAVGCTVTAPDDVVWQVVWDDDGQHLVAVARPA